MAGHCCGCCRPGSITGIHNLARLPVQESRPANLAQHHASEGVQSHRSSHIPKRRHPATRLAQRSSTHCQCCDRCMHYRLVARSLHAALGPAASNISLQTHTSPIARASACASRNFVHVARAAAAVFWWLFTWWGVLVNSCAHHLSACAATPCFIQMHSQACRLGPRLALLCLQGSLDR